MWRRRNVYKLNLEGEVSKKRFGTPIGPRLNPMERTAGLRCGVDGTCTSCISRGRCVPPQVCSDGAWIDICCRLQEPESVVKYFPRPKPPTFLWKVVDKPSPSL